MKASPSLSLSLAGVFRNTNLQEQEVEEAEDVVEISSEHTGGGGQSDDEMEADELAEEDGEVGNRKKKRKKKKYHRHTAKQICVMEELFKESPHPDDKQRQQLSKQLGLSPRQVKFWFQNRRTQIKAIQERHENSLLKSEMEKLQEENRFMKEKIKKACCPNCGFALSSKDGMTTEEQQLRIENARLKTEIERLRVISPKVHHGTVSPSSTSSAGADQLNTSSLDCRSGFFGMEKFRILDAVEHALEELIKMATFKEPLWIQSIETGHEILNYDAYLQEFSLEVSRSGHAKHSIEASRESGDVFVDMSSLLNAFMDVNQWKSMFPCMISKASTIYVIFNGADGNRNGAVQLMFAEVQMLTPMVPTRELYFLRYCKQLSHEIWAILDISIDEIEENIDALLSKCRKRPSGCIIEDKANGHCKVTWVEHIEYQKAAIPAIYRSIVYSGLAFGARHWLATLQLQCERMMFFMATNVPSKDSNGVSTVAGRKSILKLAHRMTSSFCHKIGASRYRAWSKASTNGEEGIRFATRKNTTDTGEPTGLILCAVSSTWLPVSSVALFNLFRDDSRRAEWDFVLFGGPSRTIVNLAKGKDRGNSVTLHATRSTESNGMWVLQDGYKNSYESVVVYSAVDMAGMQPVMAGCDSSGVAILPCGFAILPDSFGTRPLVITSRAEETNMEEGSLLTMAFQVVADASPESKLTLDSVDSLNNVVTCTMHNIKRALQCEDV